MLRGELHVTVNVLYADNIDYIEPELSAADIGLVES